MKRPSRALTENDAGILIALMAILLGGFVYLYQPWQAGFPINDGGLFYVMIRALQSSGLQLPPFVTYNGLHVPFVYPPLGFYLAALTSNVLSADVLLVLQWIPAVVLVLIAVCYYFVARQALGSPIEAGIATFIYVCTPRSSTWLIMGGGITRSLGQLFLLLTLAAVHRLYTRRSPRTILFTILAGSLVVLSHPEAALHALAISIVSWFILGRTRRSALDSALVAAGITVLTAIWWVPVLLQHGMGPTLAAAQTGLHNSLAFVYPLFMMFTEEPAMTIVAALAVFGFFRALARREWLLPAWMLVPFLADPRSAPTVALIAVAMLGAQALHDLILPAIAAAAGGAIVGTGRSYLGSRTVRALVGYLEAFLLVMAVYAGMQLARIRVTPANVQAMEWVRANTPPSSRFLVLTGATELFCDPVQEWFPALTGRVSTTTIQGNEWLGKAQFAGQMARLQQVQLCLNGADAAACVGERSKQAGLSFEFLYVSRVGPLTRGCRSDGDQRAGDQILAQLHASQAYETIYTSDEVEILAVRP